MLRKLFTGEKRAVSYQSVWGSGGDGWSSATLAGPSIGQLTAFKLAAVHACVRIITDEIASLPVDTFQRVNGQRVPFRPKPAWVEEPDKGITRQTYMQQCLVSYLLDGNAFIRILRKANGEVAALVPLSPQRITDIRRNDRRDIEFVLDHSKVLTSKDILHIPDVVRPGELRGISRIEELKQTLGLAAALDEYAARFFGQGSNASGVIEWPGDLTKEQAKDLVDGWELGHKGLRKAHRPGVLYGGATWKKTSVDNGDSQFLESRQFAVEEIARIFGVPLHKLQVATPGAMSYSSVEQNGIQFVVDTLRPIIAKFEAAHSRLIPLQAAFVKWNLDGLLRGDLQSRYSAYSTGMQAGFLNINDIHRLEDMPPVEGGDVYRVPLANVNLDAANVVETSKLVTIATQLVNIGFDPAETLQAFGLPEIAHTGLPSVQLANPSTVNPDDPASVYPSGDN